MRAVSTVLDVAVFLLLVSAAVGTVAYAPAPVEPSHDTSETASLLATMTATVEYSVSHQQRQHHGTLGSLLGRAAVANATLGGTPLTPMAGEFRAAVQSTVRERLPRPNTTQVTALWRPYPDAPLSGRVSVGAPPPAGVDVSVATVTVPAVVDATATATAARLSGYHGLSLHTARLVTDALLPATAAAASTGQQNPTAIGSAARYRAFADGLGIAVSGPLGRGNISVVSHRVTRALAHSLERDMRRQFHSPAAARAALQTGTVTLTVRRWQP
jgi:hypothetical protein